MAKIKNIFLTGIETIFSVFEEAVNSGTFTVTTDNGFDDGETVTDQIRCIFEKFVADDVTGLSFGSLIQPNDIKGLVPSVDLINNAMSTKAYVLFDSENYSVEGHEIDPMNVIYTVLLRKV